LNKHEKKTFQSNDLIDIINIIRKMYVQIKREKWDFYVKKVMQHIEVS